MARVTSSTLSAFGNTVWARRWAAPRASPNLVRVFDCVAVIASHARSYDRKVQVELPEHIEALVA
jgi:hypothetical protein